ncbi:hypothetical protein P7H15_20010 [Paenibacillus larvae]|nr:hypothetical protein [Paenibacillus larvae]MDT2294634.1 hypothetical protein [Paenibacillus larvae]
MLFEDESMIRDYQAIQKTWFLRGKQRIIPTTGKHRGVKLLATVDYENGTHHFGKKMNSTPLKRFFPFFKRSWRLIQQGNWLWFWTMPGFIMQSCFGRFWKRKKIGFWSLCTCLHTASVKYRRRTLGNGSSPV